MTKTAAPKTKTPAKAKKTTPKLESAAKTPAISSNAGAATANATLPPLLADVLAAMAGGITIEVANLAARLDVGTKAIRSAIDGLRRRGHHVVSRGKCQFGLNDGLQRGSK